MAIKKRKNKVAQEETRFRIVDYLKNKPGTQKQAAAIYSVTERSVNKIWTKCKREGKRSLVSKKRGVKGGKKIKGEQTGEVRKLIKDNMPVQLKPPFGLWTREAVQQLIEQRYGIALSVKQVGRYLKSWGYTPQKPIRKAFEQKPEQVKAWLSMGNSKNSLKV